MTDNEATEEIPDEEKLKIAQFYLMSSPPGQFYEILSDVRKLLPNGLLSDSIAQGIAHNFNVKNNKIILSPAGNKIPLSTVGEVGPNKFVDPIAHAVFEVNHLTLTVTEASDVELKPRGDSELKRAALQDKVNEYISATFPAELAGGSVYEKNSSFVVVITGEKPNLRNYWSGKWSSTWTIELDTGTISGDIKVHAHYFEDGNVQLQTSKKIPAGSISTSEEEFPSSVISFIKKSETELQTGLEEMYGSMNDETFRAMRRIMPITRTKMEWNVNAVRMVRQVRK